ncbi:MAG: hypothetical protein KY455_06510 [Euryarchaeota archaeon]|nr:hypothetical protein [Euryarchaeota archaeon]
MSRQKSTRKALTTTFVAAMAVGLFLLAGLPAAHGETVAVATPRGGATTAAAADATVSVVNFEFVDDSTGTPVTAVSPGTTVTWVFEQGVHSSTEGASAVFLSTPAVWDSGVILPSDSPNTFSKTFDFPGAFAYYCKVHPDTMKATLIVA